MNCDHENKITDLERGDVICNNCGLVLEERTFVNPSFLLGSEVEVGNRVDSFTAIDCGATMVDGVGSYIGYPHETLFKDKMGTQLSAISQSKFLRLKTRYNFRGRVRNQETQYRALDALNKVCATLRIPHPINQRAGYFYKKFSKTETGEKSSQILVSACCLYLAVKEVKHPISIHKIADAYKNRKYRVTAKTIVRTALSIKPQYKAIFKLKATKSEDYLNRIVNVVTSNPRVQERLDYVKVDKHTYSKFLLHESMKLLSRVSSVERGGRNPYIYAVATIYAASRKFSKEHKVLGIVTQSLLSELVDVREYSLRDHWRHIQNYLS